MNQRQFEHLVRQHQHRIYGLAYQMLSDADEAADVTQVVLLRFWKHRDRVEQDRLLGWLLRVTRNASIDALRKRAASRESVFTGEYNPLDHAPTYERSPDDRCQAEMNKKTLQRTLDGMREPYRSLVILREIQQLKYDEICDALDLPLTTVKVYLHRARKMLRTALQEVLHHESI